MERKLEDTIDGLYIYKLGKEWYEYVSLKGLKVKVLGSNVRVKVFFNERKLLLSNISDYKETLAYKIYYLCFTKISNGKRFITITAVLLSSYKR